MWFLHDGTGLTLCCLAHGELALLFLEPDAGVDHCPRIPLSCFRARTCGLRCTYRQCQWSPCGDQLSAVSCHATPFVSIYVLNSPQPHLRIPMRSVASPLAYVCVWSLAKVRIWCRRICFRLCDRLEFIIYVTFSIQPFFTANPYLVPYKDTMHSVSSRLLWKKNNTVPS